MKFAPWRRTWRYTPMDELAPMLAADVDFSPEVEASLRQCAAPGLGMAWRQIRRSTGPEQWTVDICAEFVAAVDRLVIGEWSCSSFEYRFVPSVGKPLRPQSKIFALQVMRRFLADAQNWERCGSAALRPITSLLP